MIRKLVTSLAAAFVLGACTANETTLSEPPPYLDELHTAIVAPLQDGTYFALEEHFDAGGWKRFVEIQVEEHQLISITFDAVNEFAATLKVDASYSGIEVFMEDGLHPLRWDQQMSIFEQFILDAQGLEELNGNATSLLDSITLDLTPYVELFNVAVGAGPVEMGPYLDGRYFMAQEPVMGADDDYQYFINMIVRHGYIIAVHWNAINSEGVRKYEPILPGSILDTEDEALLWRAQADLMEAHLISTQDPTQMTFDEDELSQELFAVDIPIQAFIELAVSALAAGPLLENN